MLLSYNKDEQIWYFNDSSQVTHAEMILGDFFEGIRLAYDMPDMNLYNVSIELLDENDLNYHWKIVGLITDMIYFLYDYVLLKGNVFADLERIFADPDFNHNVDTYFTKIW